MESAVAQVVNIITTITYAYMNSGMFKFYHNLLITKLHYID